jgi:CYTH domain-containing protein
MEIERKYLLCSLPSRKVLGKGRLISQGYLSAGEPEVRMRSKANTFYLTVKSGSGLKRGEFEAEIPLTAFRKLWPMTVGKRIKKTRYAVSDRRLTWEIDNYYGPLKGLHTAEVELRNLRQKVVIPSFLPVIRDITHDARYKNKNLATKGLPQRRRLQ